MRAVLWTAVLWSLCGTGVAVAQEKTEAAPGPEAQVAPPAEASAAEEKPTEAKAPAEPTPDEARPAPSAQRAQEPAPATTEPSKAVEPAAPSAAEPVRAEAAEVEKAPPAKAAAQAPFQTSWQDASPDEKALFLEAFGESSKLMKERWDKATSDERRKILRAHPLLGARAMKHHWISATPEERAAFLEATPRTVQKVKEAWENATPEQRKMLALEHPYFARKALHHAWTQATPQERIAFLVANPALHAELKARWSGANAWQRQWYVKNYPGIESLAAARHWAEVTTEQRAIFLEANPAIEDRVREAWQKAQPEVRAALARKWQGWPLKAYQARLENAKPVLPGKTRPAATTTMKKTAKAGTRRP
jgi:2-oxo-4-hydroxy-4-carboxy--5-ureidoimidazoline (OHCU) decarboxylase